MLSNIYEKMIKRVTDNYNRADTSNIAKMMKLAAHHIQENEDLLDQIDRWRDIDQAEGVTLDYIGRNIGQDRKGFEDDVFRVLIKAKVIKNNSDGSIPTIIRFLAFILGVDKKLIKVQEKWINGEPIGLHIEVDLPFVEALGLPIMDFVTIVNDLLGPGINADILINGTFMFSDGEEMVEDAEHGLGEIVTDQNYYHGEFSLGDIGKKYTIEGLADEELPQGGKFGAYYKINGFKEGTNKIIRAW